MVILYSSLLFNHLIYSKGLSDLVRFDFYVVGVGGTGGYFVNLFARELAARDFEHTLCLIDDDRIESKNIERQPFFSSEVGQYKSVNLSRKVNSVYPKGKTRAFAEYIEEPGRLLELFRKSDGIPVLIGCVDNNHARVVFKQVFDATDTIFYLDSGNGEWSGNVVMGAKLKGDILFPQVSTLFPEMLDTSESIRASQEKCTTRIASGVQRAGTNQFAAVILSNMASSILDGEPVSGPIFFNSSTLTCGDFLEKKSHVNPSVL